MCFVEIPMNSLVLTTQTLQKSGSGARFADAEWDIDTSCLEKDMWKLALLVSFEFVE